jgi:A49-like RNA polymerase I associated factor
MRRVKVQEYRAAPSSGDYAETETATANPALSATRHAIQNGHPSVVAFESGDEAAPCRLAELNFVMELDTESEKLHLSGVRPGSGNNSEEEWRAVHASNPLVVDYIMAVVDKKKGTAKLVDISGEFRLSKRVKHAVSASVNASTQTRDVRSYAEKQNDLLQSFGSKRARESKAKSSMNAITDARISAKTATQLETAIEVHQDKYPGQESGDSTTSTLAPPHHATAARPEDAFPLGGLMTSVEFSHLHAEASTFLGEAVKSNDVSLVSNTAGFNDSIWALLIEAVGLRMSSDSAPGGGGARSLAGSPDEACRRVMSAMYLQYLVVLAQTGTTLGVRDRISLLEKMAVPQEVLRCILERFTERQVGKSATERLRSESMRSRLVYYAVVYWLTASGFAASGSLEGIAAELQITPAKFMIHIAHVGGKVKRIKSESQDGRGSSYRAYLSVPLVFPALRRRAGVSKRK